MKLNKIEININKEINSENEMVYSVDVFGSPGSFESDCKFIIEGNTLSEIDSVGMVISAVRKFFIVNRGSIFLEKELTK